MAMFGDSITDGFMAALGVPLLSSTKRIGQDVPYPDHLQCRARLDRDVQSLNGVTDALILIGINDLGFSITPPLAPVARL